MDGKKFFLQIKLDAFIICIDVNYTLEVLLKALDTGKPIFVEKPISFKSEPLDIIKTTQTMKIFSLDIIEDIIKQLII